MTRILGNLNKTALFLLIWIMMLLTFDGRISFAGWLIYHKPALRGKVMDAATKEPIEKAVVMVFYQTYPIISGPAGGSAKIIKVKEALTDENGEFHFPAYTTIIQPNAIEDNTDLIIYKPGYGHYPSAQINPLHEIVADAFFSEKIGTVKKLVQGPKVIPIVYGIVELPKLTTREERLRAIPGTPSHLRSNELPLFYKAKNEEYRRFGAGEVK